MAALKLFIFHLGGAVLNIYGLIYDLKKIDIPGLRGTYGGRWKYLTFWNMIIQAVYFTYCVINDIFGTNTRPGDGQHRSRMQKFRDEFHASIMFPIGTFVVITFWGIYAVDRELVYPKKLDAIIPAWLNHVMHTTILPLLLVDKYVVHHQYPSRNRGLSLTIGFALLYQLWILWIAYHAKIWVYPVLAVLSWPGRAAFLGGLWVFLIIIYLAGEFVTKRFWSSKKIIHQE